MDWYTAQCNVTGHHETFVEYPLIPEVMFLSSFSITYPTISYKQNFKGVRLGVNTGWGFGLNAEKCKRKSTDSNESVLFSGCRDRT